MYFQWGCRLLLGIILNKKTTNGLEYVNFCHVFTYKMLYILGYECHITT